MIVYFVMKLKANCLFKNMHFKLKVLTQTDFVSVYLQLKNYAKHTLD